MNNKILTRIAVTGCKIVFNKSIEKEKNHVWFK
jgi:hypothetical protein